MFFEKGKIVLIFLIVVAFDLKAQYVYEWQEDYDNNSMEEVASLVRCNDGNVILAGLSKGKTDKLLLTKIDLMGNVLWTREIGGYPFIIPKKIIRTADSNYLIAGTAAEFEKYARKIWLVKINKRGKVLWQKTYKAGKDVFCSDVVQTNDGGFIAVGYYYPRNRQSPDWYLLKVNDLGYFEWKKILGGDYDDKAKALTVLKDGTIAVAGYFSYAKGFSKRATIFTLDQKGNELGYYEINDKVWSEATAITSTSDTAFVFFMQYKDKGLIDFDYEAIKMDESGRIIWRRTIQTEHSMITLVSAVRTYDQGIAATFTEKKFGIFGNNVGILKLSPLGEIAWAMVFTRRRSEDFAAQIIEGKDNSLLVGVSKKELLKGANYSVLKYRSVEMTNLVFENPAENIITLNDSILNFSAYITGYKKPKNLLIYNNGKKVEEINNFSIKMTQIHKYPVNSNIKLSPGKNKIVFVLTDYKDFRLVKTIFVYYLPIIHTLW